MTASVTGSFAAWCTGQGLDRHVFMELLLGAIGDEGSAVASVERGEITPAEYERALASLMTATYGRPIPADGLLRGLFAEAHLDVEMRALVDEARAAGHRTALVSNSWGDLRYAEEVRASFDAIVLSGELGIRKPDPAIFVEAARCIFVDDLAPNLTGACSLGMHVVHHRDAGTTGETVRAFLSSRADAQTPDR